MKERTPHINKNEFKKQWDDLDFYKDPKTGKIMDPSRVRKDFADNKVSRAVRNPNDPTYPTEDHKIARAKNGTNKIPNLQIASLKTNREKGTMSVAKYKKVLATKGIINDKPKVGTAKTAKAKKLKTGVTKKH